MPPVDGRSKYSWSLAFHPIHSHILASAGLNGNVRVFDTKNESSQEWQNPAAVQNMTVTSLAFHPTLDLLAIASNCQLFFWNWRTGEDVGTANTGKLSQKVRLVKFDSKGRLIAVISNESQPTESSYMRPSLVNYMLSREYGASNNGIFGVFAGGGEGNNLNILRNVFRLSSVSTAANAAVNFNLAGGDPPSQQQQQQQQANSNLNNLRNIVSQIQRQPTPGEAAFRLSDNGGPGARPQNRSSEEALYNFASALADSIRSDQLLPDDLPSFSFLRNNYQTSSPSLRHIADRMRQNFDLIRRDGQIIISSNNSSQNNEPVNEAPSRSSNSSEDLNALVFESVNVVERFISRQRTLQENWSAPESPSSSSSSSSSGMPYRNRDYIIRRRLSRQILRPGQQADTQRSSSLEEASSPREISRNISRTVIDALRESRSIRHSGPASNSSASQSTSATNRRNSNNGNPSSSSNSQDNHSLFYYLLQHQAFRSGARQELNNGVPSSEISAIVSQIQRSINLINQNNPHLANEEMQQLHSSGHAVLQRITFFIRQREKLCHYKQIILNMLIESGDNEQRSEQRNDLHRFFGFVQLLIRQADEIQRTLINDLRYYELNRLYLMRRRTADAAARQSQEVRLLNEEEESSSSDTQPSSSSGGAVEDDAIPSTSAGTSRGVTRSKRKNEEGTDEDKAKKFKIPVVRISTNEGDEESQPSSSNSPTTTTPGSPTRDQQLREEMNRLISNLEILFERLSSSSRMYMAHPLAPQFVNSLNFFHAALPILSPRQPTLISARLINSASLNNPAPSAGGGQAAPANPPQHFATFYIAPSNPGQFLNNEFAQLHSLNADINQTTYRILCFDLKQDDDPALSIDLSTTDSRNLVVPKSKVANDSSVDLSRNGELLACLVPIEGSTGLMLSIFSIRKASLGDCLFVYGSVNAISVSFR